MYRPQFDDYLCKTLYPLGALQYSEVFKELIENITVISAEPIIKLSVPPCLKSNLNPVPYLEIILYFLNLIHKTIITEGQFGINELIAKEIRKKIQTTIKATTKDSPELIVPYITEAIYYYKITIFYDDFRQFLINQLNDLDTQTFRNLYGFKNTQFTDTEEQSIFENEAEEYGAFGMTSSFSLVKKNQLLDSGMAPNFFTTNAIIPFKRVSIPDAFSYCCLQCRITFSSSYFSYFNGTKIHHCRLCGGVFCNNCSNNWADLQSLRKEDIFGFIPDSIKGYGVTDIIQYWMSSEKTQRVCKNCHYEVERHFTQESKVITHAFGLLKLPVISLIRASKICKPWRESSFLLLKWIKKMIYSTPIPTKEAVPVLQWEYLWRNQSSFVSHNPWLIQLLKYYPFENQSQIETFTELVRKSLHGHLPSTSCLSTLCTRSCSDPFALLSFLYEHCKSYDIRKIVLEKIDKTYTDEQVQLFLPFFVKCLSYEVELDKPGSPLWEFLEKKANGCRVIRDTLFFLIRYKKYSKTEPKFYDTFTPKLAFIFAASLEARRDLELLGKFCDILDEIQPNDSDDSIKTKVNLLNRLGAPISLPIKSGFWITTFEAGSLLFYPPFYLLFW